jgi:flagellar assembly protein FliH
LFPAAAERNISLSKVIDRPRLVDTRIRIGPSDAFEGERTVPESQYRELESKVETLANEGYQRGLREGDQAGYQRGLSEGKVEAQRIINQLQPLLTEIVNHKNQIYHSAEKDVLELAMILAKKVIGIRAECCQELVLDTVKQSLPLLLEKSRLTIKVAPEQEKFLNDNFANILEMDKDLKEIKIESDRRISPGGCILETSSGRVDARIEKQLEVLTTALQKQSDNTGN